CLPAMCRARLPSCGTDYLSAEGIGKSILLRRTVSTRLQFVFYFAVKPEKLWEGLFSPESNRIIFTGADFEADMKPGGSMKWIGSGADGKPATLVKGEMLRSDRPNLCRNSFQLGH